MMKAADTGQSDDLGGMGISSCIFRTNTKSFSDNGTGRGGLGAVLRKNFKRLSELAPLSDRLGP
jgi:hypothetical protein